MEQVVSHPRPSCSVKQALLGFKQVCKIVLCFWIAPFLGLLRPFMGEAGAALFTYTSPLCSAVRKKPVCFHCRQVLSVN